ncbi:trypsin-1-like [Folsomia candida]|uniref:trypsin-1-like n=1 Tax=Folsomia candida TaxID=158441 RepID=UPI001604D191|nr:trypsin-1-like [Folsomia candida]
MKSARLLQVLPVLAQFFLIPFCKVAAQDPATDPSCTSGSMGAILDDIFTALPPTRRDLNATARIIGGHDAHNGELPWMVALYEFKPDLDGPLRDKFEQICGAVLISGHFVLTAAHCLYFDGLHESQNWEKVLVKVGSTSRAISQGDTRSQFIRVAQIVLHFEFDDEELYNDIILIRLCQDALQIPGTAPAVLADPNDPANGQYAVPMFSELTVAGWGLDKNEEEPENYPRILQTTTVQLQLFDGCNTDVYDDDLRKDIQICCGVRGGGRDICKGDSGGPLIFLPNILIGIASHQTGDVSLCGDASTPAVYAYAPAYSDWVFNQVHSMTGNPFEIIIMNKRSLENATRSL